MCLYLCYLVSEFDSCCVCCSSGLIVDCLAYPYTVFSRQCQVFPYNAATLNLSAPFSTTIVMHHIAQTQVRNYGWL